MDGYEEDDEFAEEDDDEYVEEEEEEDEEDAEAVMDGNDDSKGKVGAERRKVTLGGMSALLSRPEDGTTQDGVCESGTVSHGSCASVNVEDVEKHAGPKVNLEQELGGRDGREEDREGGEWSREPVQRGITLGETVVVGESVRSGLGETPANQRSGKDGGVSKTRPRTDKDRGDTASDSVSVDGDGRVYVTTHQACSSLEADSAGDISSDTYNATYNVSDGMCEVFKRTDVFKVDGDAKEIYKPESTYTFNNVVCEASLVADTYTVNNIPYECSHNTYPYTFKDDTYEMPKKGDTHTTSDADIHETSNVWDTYTVNDGIYEVFSSKSAVSCTVDDSTHVTSKAAVTDTVNDSTYGLSNAAATYTVNDSIDSIYEASKVSDTHIVKDSPLTSGMSNINMVKGNSQQVSTIDKSSVVKDDSLSDTCAVGASSATDSSALHSELDKELMELTSQESLYESLVGAESASDPHRVSQLQSCQPGDLSKSQELVPNGSVEDSNLSQEDKETSRVRDGSEHRIPSTEHHRPRETRSSGEVTSVPEAFQVRPAHSESRECFGGSRTRLHKQQQQQDGHSDKSKPHGLEVTDLSKTSQRDHQKVSLGENIVSMASTDNVCDIPCGQPRSVRSHGAVWYGDRETSLPVIKTHREQGQGCEDSGETVLQYDTSTEEDSVEAGPPNSLCEQSLSSSMLNISPTSVSIGKSPESVAEQPQRIKSPGRIHSAQPHHKSSGNSPCLKSPVGSPAGVRPSLEPCNEPPSGKPLDSPAFKDSQEILSCGRLDGIESREKRSISLPTMGTSANLAEVQTDREGHEFQSSDVQGRTRKTSELLRLETPQNSMQSGILSFPGKVQETLQVEKYHQSTVLEAEKHVTHDRSPGSSKLDFSCNEKRDSDSSKRQNPFLDTLSDRTEAKEAWLLKVKAGPTDQSHENSKQENQCMGQIFPSQPTVETNTASHLKKSQRSVVLSETSTTENKLTYKPIDKIKTDVAVSLTQETMTPGDRGSRPSCLGDQGTEEKSEDTSSWAETSGRSLPSSGLHSDRPLTNQQQICSHAQQQPSGSWQSEKKVERQLQDTQLVGVEKSNRMFEYTGVSSEARQCKGGERDSELFQRLHQDIGGQLEQYLGFGENKESTAYHYNRLHRGIKSELEEYVHHKYSHKSRLTSGLTKSTDVECANPQLRDPQSNKRLAEEPVILTEVNSGLRSTVSSTPGPRELQSLGGAPPPQSITMRRLAIDPATGRLTCSDSSPSGCPVDPHCWPQIEDSVRNLVADAGIQTDGLQSEIVRNVRCTPCEASGPGIKPFEGQQPGESLPGVVDSQGGESSPLTCKQEEQNVQTQQSAEGNGTEDSSAAGADKPVLLSRSEIQHIIFDTDSDSDLQIMSAVERELLLRSYRFQTTGTSDSLSSEGTQRHGEETGSVGNEDNKVLKCRTVGAKKRARSNTQIPADRFKHSVSHASESATSAGSISLHSDMAEVRNVRSKQVDQSPTLRKDTALPGRDGQGQELKDQSSGKEVSQKKKKKVARENQGKSPRKNGPETMGSARKALYLLDRMAISTEQKMMLRGLDKAQSSGPDHSKEAKRELTESRRPRWTCKFRASSSEWGEGRQALDKAEGKSRKSGTQRGSVSGTTPSRKGSQETPQAVKGRPRQSRRDRPAESERGDQRDKGKPRAVTLLTRAHSDLKEATVSRDRRKRRLGREAGAACDGISAGVRERRGSSALGCRSNNKTTEDPPCLDSTRLSCGGRPHSHAENSPQVSHIRSRSVDLQPARLKTDASANCFRITSTSGFQKPSGVDQSEGRL